MIMVSSSFLPSALAFIALLIFTAAQARRLASDCSIVEAAILARYGRILNPTGSSPRSRLLSYENRVLPSPPPSPKPASPEIQVGFISPCSDADTACNYNKYISMVTDSARRIRSPPKPSVPTHNQIIVLEGSPPSHVSTSA